MVVSYNNQKNPLVYFATSLSSSSISGSFSFSSLLSWSGMGVVLFDESFAESFKLASSLSGVLLSGSVCSSCVLALLVCCFSLGAASLCSVGRSEGAVVGGLGPRGLCFVDCRLACLCATFPLPRPCLGFRWPPVINAPYNCKFWSHSVLTYLWLKWMNACKFKYHTVKSQLHRVHLHVPIYLQRRPILFYKYCVCIHCGLITDREMSSNELIQILTLAYLTFARDTL